MPQKISGRTIAEKLTEQLAADIKKLKRPPGFAAVLIGNDPASHLYVGLKERACKTAGILFEKHILPTTITQAEVLTLIKTLNATSTVDGILIQLPLPKHLQTDKIIAAMDPLKDADGFHPDNLEKIVNGKEAPVTPVLLNATTKLLRSTGVDFNKKKCVIIGNSEVFCKTMRSLHHTFGLEARCVSGKQLLDKPAAVTEELKKTDVLIVAVGSPRAVVAGMIKKDAVIIDIGINRGKGGVVGDVARGAYSKSSWFTPVPGGVGPVTVACLLENVVALAKLHLD